MFPFQTLLAAAVVQLTSALVGALEPRPIATPPPGAVLWVRADGELELGISNLVERWADASASAHDLLGRDGPTLPRYDRFGHAGRPALSFDGNDVLERPEGMPAGDYTKVVLLRPEALAGEDHVLSSSDGHGLALLPRGVALTARGVPFAASTAPLALGEPAIVVATFDADTGVGRIRLNGALAAAGTAPAPNDDVRIQLGGDVAHGHFRGWLIEALVYDRVLGAFELALVERYLADEHLSGPPVPMVELTRVPKDGTVLPRNGLDTGDLEVEGVVRSPGFTEIELSIEREGELWQRVTVPLTYVEGQAAFSLAGTVRAELAEFSMRVVLRGPGGEVPVAERVHLVCGDVFLVQGQSIALAEDFHEEDVADEWESPWVRSFGVTAPAELVDLDHHWDVARARVVNLHAAVGAWGVRMGANLVASHGVPVAFLNGAESSTPILAHQRDDSDPESLFTPYGRLLRRARVAGVEGAARAIFWYQGEADGSAPEQYAARFASLRDDWLEDFPSLEKIYVFQVRAGCGVVGPGVREVQRTLGETYPDVELMSTTSVPGHDGCHFHAAGYAEIGDRITRLAERDFFGVTGLLDVVPPTILDARATAPERILISFAGELDTLSADPGVELYFATDDPSVAIERIVADGNTLELELSGPTSATTVSFLGEEGDGPGVRNARGVGALTFFGFPMGR